MLLPLLFFPTLNTSPKAAYILKLSNKGKNFKWRYYKIYLVKKKKNTKYNGRNLS